MHLYLHIPFCKQQCSYCNFHFSTLMRNKVDMVEAISKELVLRKHEITSPLQTIYFGGGTPSVLTHIELNQLLHQIEALFEIESDAEISLEANPDDLTADKIKALRHTPINRLSIGVQSFFDEDLQLMNRAHNAQEADGCIKRSQDAGFENITIDLIYGAPTTTNLMWQENLDKAVALEVPHISSYALTVEPKTALKHQIKVGKVQAVDDEKQQNQFNMLVETLTQNGFEHYEISNFGKPSFHSQHNAAYWLGKPYIGVGPSAHSFDLKSRSWNIANNTQYMQSIAQNIIPAEKEVLSPKDIMNELTMIGLRTMYGIDVNYLKQQVPEEIYLQWEKGIAPFIAQGQIIAQDNKLYLNPDFRFFADGIASQCFIV